jgi:hypothetical protein
MSTESSFSVTGKAGGLLVTLRGDSFEQLVANAEAVLGREAGLTFVQEVYSQALQTPTSAAIATVAGRLGPVSLGLVSHCPFRAIRPHLHLSPRGRLPVRQRPLQPRRWPSYRQPLRSSIRAIASMDRVPIGTAWPRVARGDAGSAPCRGIGTTLPAMLSAVRL